MCQPQRATAHFFWSCEYFFSAIFLSSVLGLSLLHAYFTLLFINSWANVLGAGILDALRHYNGWAACFVHNRIQIVVNLWTYIIMCLSIISIIITLFLAFISCSRPILFLARVFYVFFSHWFFMFPQLFSFEFISLSLGLSFHHWMLPFSDLISFTIHIKAMIHILDVKFPLFVNSNKKKSFYLHVRHTICKVHTWHNIIRWLWIHQMMTFNKE